MNLWLIPTIPLVGALANLTLGRRLPKAAINAIAIGSVLFSFLWVLNVLNSLGPLETAHVERYFTWIQSGPVNIGFDLMVDRLTAVMLLVVTGVGLLIHIYATGYMAHEGGYYRFFAYLNLFMFFMLILVLAANYLVLFVGWEGVGLCSYLLIGFYFLKKSAGDAGKKAFIVNRVGDFGFILGIFLILGTFGTLDFAGVFAKAGGMPVEATVGVVTTICLLLLVGATGKSAQVPLYVWLPDAMEGPTPVSALIHAATMVTAGVYMVARSSALYMKAPLAMDAVAIIGLVTAVLAATIGLTQFDIKKVYAYSTVSQLGYMFVGLGVGAFSAGIFHVVTHAFFKALLFLGAGSVIHAMSGEQDMRHMGGLRKYTPWTFMVLLCAAVAIAGVPPFAGFHSKDAILLAAHHKYPWIYWVGVVTAGMTAFYVFRSIFMTFFGELRMKPAGDHGHHGHGHHDDHGHGHHGTPHESPWVMLGPLVILALLSLGGGYLPVLHFLEPVLGGEHAPHESFLVYTSVAAGVIGIALAYILYVAAPGLPGKIAGALGGLYRLVYDKYRVDEAYDAIIVHPIRDGSRSVLWKGFDLGFIDGIVNGVGTRARGVGGVLKLAQSGYVRSYAAWIVFGAVIAIAAIGFVAVGGVR